MNAWNNIEVSSDDQEITKINEMELSLGNLSKTVYDVRELITRFEVCHFKYQRHYEHILRSIALLRPVVKVDQIGINHIHKNTWENDTTGRSGVGHKYLSALHSWLITDSLNVSAKDQEQYELRKQIREWLGDQTTTKEKLVKMLTARLTWKPVEEHRTGGELSELEYQIEATDICNYAFPQNLDKVIQAIGKLTPVKPFDGCGTFNTEIYSFLCNEFTKLCMWLGKPKQGIDLELGEKEPAKIWLVACLAKTIKADLRLTGKILLD